VTAGHINSAAVQAMQARIPPAHDAVAQSTQYHLPPMDLPQSSTADAFGTTSATDVVGVTGTLGAESAQDPLQDDSMFADSFNDFTTDGLDTAVDGLIDFDAGEGLDESAFGEALHGMDAPEGGDDMFGGTPDGGEGGM
jgi:hypothetical protein